jgi:methyl-accepting chemotaxis protein
MESSPKRARQNFLINPPFQWAMIRWTLFISLFSSGVFYISTVIFFNDLQELGISQKLPPESPYYAFLRQEISRMNLIFTLTTFISAAIIVLFGIRFSHKIAGPIHRFRQYLKNTDPAGKTPELPDLKFREDDFFQELATDFNSFKTKIRNQSQS